MSSFLYQGAWIGAAWAAALIAVPILIHLINMMRHRRVDWAAMEFLLISQKKNRTWVLLKQILLLLMRMTAIAAVVFLVPHPKVHNQLGRLLGASKTHHIVLLDDSYSMSDRWADASAFEKAKEVVARIAADAAAQSTPQSMTLLRFSQAERAAGGVQTDVLKRDVDQDFPDWLRGEIAGFGPSETAAGPLPALKAVVQLLGEEEGDRRVIYVVSDFRARQWAAPTDLKRQLLELKGAGARLYFVNCVEGVRANLGIAELAATPGTRAVGAEMFMEVAVTNHGDSPAVNVAVSLEEDGVPRPAVTIRSIPRGETARERFRVHFEKPGEHQIVARLETDAVTTDNFRYAVLDVPAGVPVLLVDGDPAALDARFLAIALESDAKARTGINPRIEQPRFLGLNRLDEFHAIYLMNVDRLDKSSVKALEEYARAGGGVAVFLGPRWQTRFVNEELYREGQGFFPMPVAAPAVLRVDHLERAPDVEVLEASHPALAVLAGDRYKFIGMVTVDQYFALPKGWTPPPESTVKVLAQLRNRAPLAVERQFGKGRVIAFTTTAAPEWNNWATGPSFVIAMLELQAYLANQPAGAASRQVGAPLEVELDPSQYERQVRFVAPGGQASPSPADAVPRGDKLAVTLAETFDKGVYRVRLSRKDGAGEEERLFAYNVDPAEGDLKTTGRQELIAALEPVKFDFATADEFQYNVEEAGYNLFDILLYALVVLLIGEQILAWSASYHPPTRPAAAKGGVR